jgi:hypothetical protein
MNASIENEIEDYLTHAKSGSTGWMPKFLGLLTACLVGGVLSFFVLEQIYPVYSLADLIPPPMPTPEIVQEIQAKTRDFTSKNGAIDCAILGACLGLSLGLITSRNKRIQSAIAGATGGAIFGGVVGFMIGHYVADLLIRHSDQSMLESSFVFFAVWGVIALGIGLGISLVHRNARQTLSAVLSAIVGGALGAIAFNVASSTLNPSSNLTCITPGTTNERILWIACGVLMILVGFALGMRNVKSAKLGSAN